MAAPDLASARFWALFWAILRTMVIGLANLVGFSQQNAEATTHIANAVDAYMNRLATQKPLKLSEPDSFNGTSDRVEPSKL